MIKATCIYRYKDKRGNIIGYCLQAGDTPKDFSADEVKKLIKNKKISVDNLVLTKDNKLRLKEMCGIEIPEKDLGYRTLDSVGRDLLGFWTDENTVYNESTKTGALLKVGKSYWEIKYQPSGVKRIGVWVAEGWTISGYSVDKCISELNKAYNLIEKYYKEDNKEPLEKELGYDIKIYCTSTLNGHIWLMGSPKWITNKYELDSVINDFESCKFRVLEIRKQLGWDKKGSFLKGLFEGI